MRNLDLVDALPEHSFDNLTILAATIIGAPVSLVSIIDVENDRQFFKSQFGLVEPLATDRQTPLSHSFCQHVVRNNEALVVNNALQNPLVKDNKAIKDLGVNAYLGLPIYAPDNKPIGALCVIESEPRVWADNEIATMKRLASCVTTQQIDDVLDYSRSINVMAEPESIDLTELCQKIVADFDTIIELQAARVEVNKLPTINGHRLQLQSLFRHFLDNALKYCDKNRTPVVTFSAQQASKRGMVDIH